MVRTPKDPRCGGDRAASSPPLDDELYHRAREALGQGRFDLVEEALARDELDLVSLIEDLRIYQAQLELQNQELQASRADVEHALGRFSAFFASVPVAELIVDAKGLILEVNPSAEQLFELARDHLRQHFFIRLVGEAYRPAVIDAFSSAWGAERADCTEITFRTTQGRDFVGDLQIAPLPGEAGAPHQFVCAVSDRSESVRQREALRQSLERLQRSRTEVDERIRELSCLYDVLKLKSQPELAVPVVLRQIVERLPAILHDSGDAGVCIRLPSRAFASEHFRHSATVLTIPFDLPGGQTGQLQVAYTGSRRDDRETGLRPGEVALFEAVAGHLGSFLHHRADQEELARSREHYRILADYSPEWEYWIGPDGRDVYVSPACEAITGYPPGDFLADPGLTARLVHPEDKERFLAHRARVLAPEADAHRRDEERLEFRLRTRSGGWIWLDHVCTPVVGSDGRWLGRRGVNRDISARKEAEAQVARAVRLYSTLSATNQAIVRHTSEEALLKELCEIAVERGGLSACVIHRRKPGARDIEEAAACYRQGAAPGGEARAALKHGLSFPIRIEGVLAGCKTVYADRPEFFTGDVVRLLDEMADDLAFALDRFNKEAARTTAELALATREQQLAAIFRAANVGIGVVEDRRIMQANDYFFRALGYQPAEMLGKDTSMMYPDEAEYQRVGRELYPQIEAHGRGLIECRMRHKGGEVLHAMVGVAAIDPANRQGPLVFCTMDITDRKRAEARLRESEERLRLTMQATNDGLWDWDLISGRLEVNDRWFEMLGYAPGELELEAERVIGIIHPDDRAPAQRALEDHVKDGRPYSIELRMRRKDGDWLWIQARGEVVARDPNGRALRMVGTNADIDARKAAEVALQESHRRLTEAERLAHLGHWQYDLATGQPIWSEQVYHIFGLDPSKPPPHVSAHAQLFHVDDVGEYRRLLTHTIETGAPFELKLRVYRNDGTLRWLCATGRLERDVDGSPRRLFGTAQDVTEQHRAEERLRQAAQVFANIADGVLILDDQQRILAVNAAFGEITGYEEADVLGQTPHLLQSGRRRDEILFRSIWAVLSKTDSWTGELWSRRKGGELYRARMTISTVFGEDGRVHNYIVVIGDITSATQAKEQLDFLAHHDPLTSLPNRSLFRSRLEHGLQRAERDGAGLAVMLVDLNRFRVVNDSLGHAQGDVLLRQVATSLLAALRPGDTLARLASDEFGLIVEDLADPLDATEMAGQLLGLCAVPRVVSNHELLVTASLGISIYPSDGRDAETLLRHADVALKRAKQQGPNVFQFYEEAMELDALRRLRIETGLRQAPPAGELSLHFQPQVRLADGGLIGAEALLRWTSQDLGPVPPGQFIPLAEEIGLIGEIGAWVIERACEQIAEWDRRGWCLPRLAVNLSIRQLERGGLAEQIREILEQTGIEAGRIELEITESTIMSQAEVSLEVLNALKGLGLRLVIDDFGTGYSSLAYLKRLPLDQLKIDKSFVDDLLEDPNSLAIAQAILALGRSLGLEVLAEGVEGAEVLELLRREGCDLAQGYHFDRPLPAEDFADRWLVPHARRSPDRRSG